MSEQLMTASQAASYLQVSPHTVRRWCAQGRIPGRRAGRRWSIPSSELARLTVFAWTIMSHETGHGPATAQPAAPMRG